MKIYREVRIDIDTNEITYEDSFDYEGKIALCGGGDGGGDGGFGGGVLEGPPGAPGSAGPNAAAPEPDLGGDPSKGKGKADPSKGKGKGKSGLGASLGTLDKSDIESEIADIADMEGGIESEGEIHGPSKEDTFLEETVNTLEENKSKIIAAVVPFAGALNMLSKLGNESMGGKGGFLDQDMTGNVADYGGGDPDMGGGPDDPYRDQMKTKETKVKPKEEPKAPIKPTPKIDIPDITEDDENKKDIGQKMFEETQKIMSDVKRSGRKRKGYLSTFLADDLGIAPVFKPKLF